MKHNPFSLEGKVVLVTGASSGIGAQCAIDCSNMGARVILVGRNETRLNETLTQMTGDGHTAICYDLGNLNGIAELVEQLHNSYIHIDGLIHGAGIEKTIPLKFLLPQDYEEVWRINTLSAFELIRCISSIKYKNTGCHFVLISSIASVIGRLGVTAYAASKGAMVAAVKPMALELAAKQMTVNCVSPGTVLTPMMNKYLSSLSEENKQKRLSGFPLGVGTVNDVSNVCTFLLSNAAHWITGQNIVVDGGYTIQ